MEGAGWLGGTALALAALAYDVLLATLRRVDRAFPSTDPTESTWWFGYTRDLVNLCGFILFFSGFIILELRRPYALLAAGFLTMTTYGIDYLLGRTLSVQRAGIALAIVLIGLVLPLAALRRPLDAGLSALVRALF